MGLSGDYFTEAIEWLTRNKNEYAFAGNRFGKTQAALEFVKELYQAGAHEVVMANVYDEAWRIEADGGPYADSLIVLLPVEPQKRAAIFAIYMKEMSAQGGVAGESDHNQDSLFFWWD